MNYDVHNHHIPNETIEMLRHDGSSFDIEVLQNKHGNTVLKVGVTGGAGPLPGELTDLDGRIRTMDAAGVDVHIMSYRTDLTAYFVDPMHGGRYARLLNR